jgi:hypothetical protein
MVCERGWEGKRRILIVQSVPPTPFGMAFGRLKLSPQVIEKNASSIITTADEKGMCELNTKGQKNCFGFLFETILSF